MSPGLLYRLLVVSLVLLLMATGAQAAFYKWHDEEGQVHYSHLPPQGGRGLSVEVIDTRALHGLRMRAHQEGGVAYCGSYALPESGTDAMGAIFRLRRAIDRWHGEIEASVSRIDSEGQRRAMELRCAIDYANAELLRLGEVEQQVVEDYQGISEELGKLRQELTQCLASAADKADCRSQYRPRIEELETVHRVLEKTVRQMEQGQ